MMLTIDTIALFTIFTICILRLNEHKHHFARTVMLAAATAGTFGLCCEQLARGRVFGPDVWVVMMHIGIAGLLILRFACLRQHDPERRSTSDRRLAL